MSLAVIVIAVIAGAVWVFLETRVGIRRAHGHWPLYAKSLLTERETEFYRRLEAMYPEHRIFVQVALSQLLEVSPGIRDRQAIRNRFDRLVADFVLCNRDLSVVAVIELDDSSHTASSRQKADRRKTKALESAGLRLVRIPAGPFPSTVEMRRMIRAEQLEICRDVPIASDSPPEMRGGIINWLRPVLGPLLIVIVVGGGWFVYSQLLRSGLPTLAPPLRAPAAPLVSPTLPPVSPPRVDLAAAQEVEQRQEQAERALAAQHAADVLAKRKAAAWLAFYQAPASCEHPAAWADQVECGNLYIRAKKAFETKWQAQVIADSASGESGSAVSVKH